MDSSSESLSFEHAPRIIYKVKKCENQQQERLHYLMELVQNKAKHLPVRNDFEVRVNKIDENSDSRKNYGE